MVLTKTLIIAVIGVISACAGHDTRTIANAFDDSVNETATTGSSLIDYRSVLSVSGLAPAQSIGSFAHHPSRVSPTHGVGISPKWSFYTITEYDSPSQEEYSKAVQALLTTYFDLQSLAVKVFDVRSRIALAWSALGEERGHKLVLPILAQVCGDKSEGLDEFSSIACAQQVLDDMQTDLSKMKADFSKLAAANRLVITRWSRRSDERAAASYGQVAVADIATASAQSGILILGGIRVYTLYVGEDFLDMYKQRRSFLDRQFFTGAGILTYQVQGKHLVYVSDTNFRRALAARASATSAELGSIRKILKLPDTKLSLEYESLLLSDVGNVGSTGNAKTTYHPYCFFPPASQQKAIRESFAGMDDYTTVYSVRSTLSTLGTIVVSAPPTELDKVYAMVTSEKRNNPSLRVGIDRTDASKDSYGYYLTTYEKQCGTLPEELGEIRWNPLDFPLLEGYMKNGYPPYKEMRRRQEKTESQ